MNRNLSVLILCFVVFVLSASLWLIVKDVFYPSLQNNDGTLNIINICLVCCFVSFWMIAILKLSSIITRIHGRMSSDVSSALVKGELLEKNGFEKKDEILYFIKYKETNGDFVKIWVELCSEKFPACSIKIQRARIEYPEISDIYYESDLEFDWIINVSDLISILRVYRLEKVIII